MPTPHIVIPESAYLRILSRPSDLKLRDVKPGKGLPIIAAVGVSVLVPDYPELSCVVTEVGGTTASDKVCSTVKWSL
jgi:hypothetical protein